MLPMVRIDVERSFFISRTTSTASRATSCVFAQESGSVNVDENTTFDMSVSDPVPGSLCAANPDMMRYVVAPISTT
jgi:hypothetical protein